MVHKFFSFLLFLLSLLTFSCVSEESSRSITKFNTDWQFRLEADSSWKTLDLPHDWSIEGTFSPDHPAGVGGGALPGGIGWYKKDFTVSPTKAKYFIRFDGVYQNSTVWVNGDSVGNRPNGYISFEYDITPFVNKTGTNELLVKVANAPQPNSRWYSGSGIYRNVHLIQTNDIYIPTAGIYVKPELINGKGEIKVDVSVRNDSKESSSIQIKNEITDAEGSIVYSQVIDKAVSNNSNTPQLISLTIDQPKTWSTKSPHLYQLTTSLLNEGIVVDEVTTRFGIRSIRFDANKGFFLNNKPVKIKGVCLHHDLGPLGAAFNKRAMERQLEIMQEMGVNSIRTAHNPPAPELLDLCDEMGILVMDEMFDMWAKSKTEFDYSMYWDDWHEKDLRDFILRDRNHPSVIVWSIGNEIIEQYNHADSSGGEIARELASIVREIDSTRPIITANNDASPDNTLIRNGGLELLGYNYNHEKFEDVPIDHPAKPFIATETNSALATRGYYDMPSDSIRIWPEAWDKLFEDGNPDNTVSAYDHVRAPWGSTHEDTWRVVKNNEFISGLYVWTGFDYLGEPTPYVWPSRSSYFGIVDLAGFPKDSYYMYKSEWTEDTVLHVFPHWNWEPGKVIDIWAYYNQADEVELFVNDKSHGVKSKGEDEFHVMWRVPYEPGKIRVVSRKEGQEVLSKEIRTAGEPHHLVLEADRDTIYTGIDDLSFITVQVVDEQGTEVPNADNLIRFNIEGSGEIIAVGNGDPTSHQSFKDSKITAFNGRCLVVVKAGAVGEIQFRASSEKIDSKEILIQVID
ncbi:MAG: glycoside hydrolase family 2 TIM barrel-domain containing protein [Marinoscillum sp.]